MAKKSFQMSTNLSFRNNVSVTMVQFQLVGETTVNS